MLRTGGSSVRLPYSVHLRLLQGGGRPVRQRVADPVRDRVAHPW
nr:MAG TPA: hypothetical protein [Caudoviricetes sp.]